MYHTYTLRQCKYIFSMDDKCTLCKYNTKKNKASYANRRILRGGTHSWHRQYLSETYKIAAVSELSILCGKCFSKLKRHQRKVRENPSIEPMSAINYQSESQSSVSLKGLTASKTHAECIICKVKVKKGLCTIIPAEARFDMLIRFRIYTDPECRICFSHLTGSYFSRFYSKSLQH